MITIPEACEKIIKRSRYLNEAISKNLINLSSLARYIKPEVEDILKKNVTDTAIIMTLNRFSHKIKPQYSFKNIFKTTPEITVRSNLTEITLSNSVSLSKKCSLLIKTFEVNPKHFFTITQGLLETTIIYNSGLKEQIRNILEGEEITEEMEDVSSITIQLPPESILTPGVFYFFLKSIAWEGINILEIVSSHLELTIIVGKSDAQRTFAVIESLFAPNI